ncbi:hypothetical protein F8M41_008411 [Gigaspora margarita]|uniref:Uncharacterized protein n=1 Tax=Gigaspora margarita TaxID=4874 RepID=A0A8H3X4A2_GIGMA|nr:hypothetical protein F8M41_008411 [Gigaspora margarita]
MGDEVTFTSFKIGINNDKGIIAPILWSHPTVPYNDRKLAKLIEIFIFELNNEEKEALKSFQIPSSKHPNSLLFDYSMYISIINSDNLHKGIKIWQQTRKFGKPSLNLINNVKWVLIKMILRKSMVLNHLNYGEIDIKAIRGLIEILNHTTTTSFISSLNPKWSHLNLEAVNPLVISSEGGNALVDALFLSYMTVLNLSTNSIRFGDSKVESALNKNSLTSLDLSSNVIDDNEGTIIACVLRKHKLLTHLNLENSKLGPNSVN